MKQVNSKTNRMADETLDNSHRHYLHWYWHI